MNNSRLSKINESLNRIDEKLKVLEAKQVGTIYHVCSIKDYLKYILPKDTLQASGMYYNYAYGGDYYVSFTRDKNFVIDTRSEEEVVFVQLVVDGDKLSENYKVAPYNDFAFDDEGNRKDDDPKNREMEECVKGPIKNISKYIKEVRFDVVACHELTAEPDLSLLKRKRKVLQDLVYYRFIRGRDANFGIDSGASLKEFLAAMEKWMQKESRQELLFSYDEDDVADGIELGADVNQKHDADGYPIIYYCEDDDSVQIIKMLLKAGANPNVTNNDGIPALSFALDNMCDNIVKALLKAKADIEATDKNGATPLMHAVASDNAAMVKLLLKEGANVNAKDKSGKSVLQYTDKSSMIKTLQKAGAVEQKDA
jgi:hypothetical protein